MNVSILAEIRASFKGGKVVIFIAVFLAVVAAIISTPAAAATWAFGGTGGVSTAYTTTLANIPTRAGTATVSLTASARRFTPLPSALTNVSQLISTRDSGSNLRVIHTKTSIGVFGGGNSQLDTDDADQYEALLLSADHLLRLKGVQLSFVDAKDTLQVYGIAKGTGALVNLRFDGRIASGLAGAATFVNTTMNSGTTALTFTNTAKNVFSAFVFTTRDAGDILTDNDLGQGYRIDSLTADVLPEPSSWALLVVGFGCTGAVMRRRNAAVA